MKWTRCNSGTFFNCSIKFFYVVKPLKTSAYDSERFSKSSTSPKGPISGLKFTCATCCLKDQKVLCTQSAHSCFWRRKERRQKAAYIIHTAAVHEGVKSSPGECRRTDDSCRLPGRAVAVHQEVTEG